MRPGSSQHRPLLGAGQINCSSRSPLALQVSDSLDEGTPRIKEPQPKSFSSPSNIRKPHHSQQTTPSSRRKTVSDSQSTMCRTSLDRTTFGSKKRHSGHSFGGKPDDWDLAFIMDASYSPKPNVTITSAAPYTDAQGDMHDPDYRPFAMPPLPPAVRKGTTEAYEEQLEVERRCWLSGRAQSPIRPYMSKQRTEELFQPCFTAAPRSRSSTVSSTSSCGVRKALHPHDISVFDDDFPVEGPSSAQSHGEVDAQSSSYGFSDGDEEPEQSQRPVISHAESLRQKMLSAHLGLQFSVMRTERRFKRGWAKTKKETACR